METREKQDDTEELSLLDDSDHNIISSARLLAFSDGVFAIAITLLVFNIKLPEGQKFYTDQMMWERILSLAPTFGSYIASFIVIGIYWIHHHRMFHHIRRCDVRLLWLNLVFLFFIAFLPFPSSLLGLQGGQRVSCAFYAVCLSLTGFSAFMLWRHASKGRRLISHNITEELIRYNSWRSVIASVVFAISAIISLYIHPALSQVVWMLIPFTYLILKLFFHKSKLRQGME